MLVLRAKVTVGICAYNEGNNVGQLLNNLLFEQQLSEDSEILVVCSGCTDNTVQIVQKYQKLDPRVKSHIEKERTGKAPAINYILKNATGDSIFLISADTLPQKQILPVLVSKLDAPNVGIVCGNPVPVNDSHSLVGRIVQVLWHFHGHVFEELNDAGLARHASEGFLIRKGIVDQIPAQTINDDAYIAVTTKKKGWLILFSSKSKISMRGPKNFSEYFQQRRRIIFGHFQLRKLTGESPQYLVQMAPLEPLRAVKLASWLFTQYDVFTLGAFFLTEFAVNVVAAGDCVFGKKHVQWQVLPSTKDVIPHD